MTCPLTPDDLVDARTGLVVRLRPQSGGRAAPAQYRAITADVADVRQFADWSADRVAMGATIGDEAAARQGAIGEAVERYCGNRIPDDLPRASAAQLLAEGRRVVPMSAWQLYSEEQYRREGFPFVVPDDQLVTRWATSTELATGEQWLVPAPLAHLNYYVRHREQEPPLTYPIFAGVATGTSRADAERRAMEELVERDAVMTWWLRRGPVVELEAEPWQDAMVAGAPEQYRPRFLAVENDFGLPVVAAWIHDPETGIGVLGSACRASARQAAEKAYVEAVHLFEYCTALLDPDGHPWQAVADGVIEPYALLPYRADRSYLAACTPGWTNLTSLFHNLQVQLDPAFAPAVRHLDQPVARRRVPDVAADDLHAHLLGLFTKRGLGVHSVRLTTSDVALTGLEVVRVLVPGLVLNGPSAYPFLGSQRLLETPRRLGWEPCGEHNLAPLPYA